MKDFLKFNYSKEELKNLDIHFLAHNSQLHEEMKKFRSHDKLWKEYQAQQTSSKQNC